MNKLSFAAFTLCAILFSIPAMADSNCPMLSTPYSATYYGSYKGWRLDTTQILKAQSNNAWQLALKADNPIGTLVQKSDYRIGADGKMLAQQYLYHRTVLFRTDDEKISFNWEKLQATSIRKEKERHIPLKGGELDDLTYQLALRCDLFAGLRTFSYQVADIKEVDTVEYKVIGEEKLATELGMLDTVVVKRIRNNNNRTTTLWFAKDLDYLMVKLLQEERKDTEAYLLYIKKYNE